MGDKTATPRHEFYYYYQVNSLEAVQKDYWKLVLPHSGRTYRGFKPGSDGWPGNTGTEKIESASCMICVAIRVNGMMLLNFIPKRLKSLKHLLKKHGRTWEMTLPKLRELTGVKQDLLKVINHK